MFVCPEHGLIKGPFVFHEHKMTAKPEPEERPSFSSATESSTPREVVAPSLSKVLIGRGAE
jgi:hypothetical protein